MREDRAGYSRAWARVIRERRLHVALLQDGLLPLGCAWPAGQIVAGSALEGLIVNRAVETDRLLDGVRMRFGESDDLMTVASRYLVLSCAASSDWNKEDKECPMATKITVIYDNPTDPAAFEAAYAGAPVRRPAY